MANNWFLIVVILTLHLRLTSYSYHLNYYFSHLNRSSKVNLHLNTQLGNFRNVLWLGYNTTRLPRSVKVAQDKYFIITWASIDVGILFESLIPLTYKVLLRVSPSITSILNYARLETFCNWLILWVGCQIVLGWRKTKILFSDKYIWRWWLC